MEPAVKSSSSIPYNDNVMNAQSSCNPSSVLIQWTNTYNTYAFNDVCIYGNDCYYEAVGGYHLSNPDICGSDPTCTVSLQAGSGGYTNGTVITGVLCEDAQNDTPPCASLVQDSWQVCVGTACVGTVCSPWHVYPPHLCTPQGVLSRASQMVADNNAVALNDTKYLAAQLVDVGNDGINSILPNYFRVR